MGAVPCPTCKQRMNDAVAVCPHCGARRPDAASGLADTKLSADEISALLAVDATEPEPSEGLLPTLLFPHARTTGAARAAEIVLTIACLPMILSGAALLAFERRRTRRRYDATSGEATPVMAMSIVGGISLGSTLVFITSTTTAIAIVGLEIAGLIVRGVIRSHASDSKSRALSRIEPPPREPQRPSGSPKLLE